MKVFVIDPSNDDRGQRLAEQIRNCDGRPQVEVVSRSRRAAKPPDGDLAFVHHSDRKTVSLERVKMLIFYSGGGGRNIEDSVNGEFSDKGLCIIDPLTCDDSPDSSKLNELIIWAQCRLGESQDCGGLPSLLSKYASQRQQEREAALIRARVLAWTMKDEQRIRRLGCNGLKALVEQVCDIPELKEDLEPIVAFERKIQGTGTLDAEEVVRELEALVKKLELKIRALVPSASAQSKDPKAVGG